MENKTQQLVFLIWFYSKIQFNLDSSTFSPVMRGRNVWGVTAWVDFSVLFSAVSCWGTAWQYSQKKNIQGSCALSPFLLPSCRWNRALWVLAVVIRCYNLSVRLKAWEMAPLLGPLSWIFSGWSHSVPQGLSAASPTCQLLSPLRAGVPLLSHLSFSNVLSLCEKFLIPIFMLLVSSYSRSCDGNSSFFSTSETRYSLKSKHPVA